MTRVRGGEAKHGRGEAQPGEAQTPGADRIDITNHIGYTPYPMGAGGDTRSLLPRTAAGATQDGAAPPVVEMNLGVCPDGRRAGCEPSAPPLRDQPRAELVRSACRSPPFARMDMRS